MKRRAGISRGSGVPKVSRTRRAGRAAWEDIRRKVWTRSGGRCEVEIRELRDSENAWWQCSRKAMDPHHVVKRSAGGPDTPENILAVCRSCHR